MNFRIILQIFVEIQKILHKTHHFMKYHFVFCLKTTIWQNIFLKSGILHLLMGGK